MFACTKVLVACISGQRAILTLADKRDMRRPKFYYHRYQSKQIRERKRDQNNIDNISIPKKSALEHITGSKSNNRNVSGSGPN